MTISILYVDENSDQIQIVTQFLNREGDLVIHSVESGHEALEIIRCSPYDAVVSAAKIHEIPGIELLKEIREMSVFISLILVSDFGPEKHIAESSMSGIDYILHVTGSPVRMYEELAVRIRRAVKKHQREQKLRERAENSLPSPDSETNDFRVMDTTGYSESTVSHTIIQSGENNITSILEKYEADCDHIIDSIIGFAWIVNTVSMKFYYISPSVHRLWKYSADELMVRSIDDTLIPGLSKPLSEFFWGRGTHHLSAENPVQYYCDEISQISKDGNPILTEVLSEYYLNEMTDHLEVRGLCRECAGINKDSDRIFFPDSGLIPEIQKNVQAIRDFLRLSGEFCPERLKGDLIRKTDLIAFAISHHQVIS